jgi:hypothetical protein
MVTQLKRMESKFDDFMQKSDERFLALAMEMRNMRSASGPSTSTIVSKPKKIFTKLELDEHEKELENMHEEGYLQMVRNYKIFNYQSLILNSFKYRQRTLHRFCKSQIRHTQMSMDL